VLSEIEEQSEFYFMYSEKLVDVKREVSLNIKNQKIKEVLSSLFDATDVNYLVKNRIIVLTTPDVYNEVAKINMQQEPITGTVTDAQTGEPLPGVNIVIQGTTQGTTTDMDGNYSIQAPTDATLVFSFVGYQERTVQVNDREEIDITMQQAVTELEEVVAVGYATRQAGEVTGSVSSVDSDELSDMAVIDASEALKGNVSGVTITESHTPGEGASIRIRGLGTINNNSPLWVVDGVPGGHVNPENIESISVLKDAAAQAIYGARASNGVVLVTTKTGKKNQPTRININVKSGVTQNTNSYNLLNTREYGEMLWLQARNQNGGTLPDDFSHAQYGSGDEPTIPEYIKPAGADEADHSAYDRTLEGGTNIIMKANKEGTDWLDEADRTATYRDVSLGLNGGNENTTYAFQGGYLEEEGIMKHTSFQRYNLRANITANPVDWLEIGERSSVTYSQDQGLQSDNAPGSIISWTYRMQPIVPVYDVMGNFAGTRAPRMGNGSNPVWQLNSNRHDWNKEFNFSGNTYLEATLLEGLSIKSLFGTNYTSSENRNLSYVEKARSQRGQLNSLGEGDWFNLQWNWSNTLQFSRTIAGMHDITAMAGTEAIRNTSRWRGGGIDQFFLTEPIYMQLDVGVQNQSINGNTTAWTLFSLFGRLNYELADKYLLEAVIRRDGSSRFGTEGNYGVFPAFSAGWRISNENFMSFSENWLDFMKIRVGYGETGNDQIGNYNSYTTYTALIGASPWGGSGSYYPIAGINNGPGTPGFKRSAFGNPNVQWETTTTTNLGVDLTILENLDITLDLWKRVTDDMLYPKQIPFVLGRATAPSINVGKMENNGFDIELGYRGSALNNELSYNLSLNLSHYQNEVVRLSGNEDEFMEGGNYRQFNYTRAEEGTAFPSFYGYKVEGIFQSEEEANNHPPAFGEEGDYNREGVFKFKDVNGDNVINADDRTYIGTPHPDFTAGFNLNASYKGFRLNARLYTSYGNEMVNTVRRMIDFNKFQGGRSHRRLYESYGSPYLDNNENATMPMARVDDEADARPSSYYIEDASFLRMQNLRLSYDLISLLNNESGFQNLTIFAQATNLFTITNYSGLDPELGAQGMNRGVDKGAWPTPRQFMFGINVGL
jgi:TonB-linked SusC/RagA family outer membrane protein